MTLAALIVERQRLLGLVEQNRRAILTALATERKP